MCGIFGLSYAADCGLSPHQTRDLLDHLFTVSQSRGQEAAGLLLRTHDGTLINKGTLSGKAFIRQKSYRTYFDPSTFRARFVDSGGFLAIGHARLDTHGSKWDNSNNAPLTYNNALGVHNGIILNTDRLWQSHPHLQRHLTVDSEILLALYQNAALTCSPAEALQHTLGIVEGSVSTAIYDSACDTLVMTTNTGSLYIADYGTDLFIFASEAYTLKTLHRKFRWLGARRPCRIQQVLPGTVLTYDVKQHSHHGYQGRQVDEVL